MLEKLLLFSYFSPVDFMVKVFCFSLNWGKSASSDSFEKRVGKPSWLAEPRHKALATQFKMVKECQFRFI